MIISNFSCVDVMLFSQYIFRTALLRLYNHISAYTLELVRSSSVVLSVSDIGHHFEFGRKYISITSFMVGSKYHSNTLYGERKARSCTASINTLMQNSQARLVVNLEQLPRSRTGDICKSLHQIGHPQSKLHSCLTKACKHDEVCLYKSFHVLGYACIYRIPLAACEQRSSVWYAARFYSKRQSR